MKNHSSTSRHLTLIFTWVFVALSFAAPVFAQYTIREVPALYTDVWEVKVNANGQVAGRGNTPTGNSAFFYDGTNLVQLSLGGTDAQAGDINDAGEVVGYAYLPGNAAQHAFLYSGGIMNDLNTLIPANSGWVLNQATAINNAGQVVGVGNRNNQQRAFLYTPGSGGPTIVDLGTLGGTATWPLDINTSGQVTGYSYTANNNSYHAFLYSNGVLSDLGTLGGQYSQGTALNDAGQVTGWAYIPGNNGRAFRYSGGTMTNLGTLGGTYSQGVAINSSGQVVGYSYIIGDSSYHPFIYTNSMVDIGTLGGPYGQAQAINDSGVVTGWAYNPSNTQHAFRYSGGTIQDINALVGACSGREIYYGQDINNAGQIVGRGNRPGVNFGYILSPGAPPSVQPTTLGARQVLGDYNSFVTLTANLSANACGVSGETVDFSLMGQPSLSATTDVNGFAYVTANLAGINAGFYPDAIAASYSGDTTHAAATDNADLTVRKAIPNVLWNQPAAITYGTPLGAAQLNATANAPGTFTYSPPAGTILPGGTHGLTAVFIPTDTTNYASPVSRSVAITVTGAQAPFVSSDLGTLGGNYSEALALNDAGQVTGWSYTSGNQFQRAFFYSNGTMNHIGTFGGSNSYPTGGINASGQVVGRANVTGDNSYHAFRYSNGTLTDLGTLGGSYSDALDINDAGQITGWAYTSNNNSQHAFRYSNGVMTDLGTLGGTHSYPQAGINASGQIAGYSYVANNASYHAFLHTGNAMVDLGTLGGLYSYAMDLNDAGQVTGYAHASDGLWHAFLYSGGVLTDLGTLGGLDSFGIAINGSGQVAGYSRLDGNNHAFLATNGQMIDLGTLGGTFSEAIAINDAGDVVGRATTPSGQQHAFLYRNGTMIDLGTLGGTFSEARGINAAGDVFGYANTANGEQHAFLYRGGVMTDLGTLGGTQSIPNAINTSGQVTGRSYITGNSSYHAFLATPTSHGTTLAVTPATGTFGGSVTLTANLTDSSTHAALATRTIQFYLNGASVGSAVTNGSGDATLNNAGLNGISSGSYPAGIEAIFAGEQNYSPSTGLAALTVDPADQTITFGALASKQFGDADFGVAATATSGLSVSFSVVTGQCTLSGALVHLTGSGSCTIRASQAGNSDYNAAPDVDQSFTIGSANQTITFAALTNKTFNDADFGLSATASSGLTVTFSTVSGQCSVSGIMVHLTGAGACTIRASQPGDSNYSAAPDVDRSFTIDAASQTITFGALATRTYLDPDFTVSATASSGLTVSFAALAGGQCTVSGNSVHITGAGACTIRASQAGNGNYNAASDVDQPFSIAKANQTITFAALADKTFGEAPFTVSATSSSGLAVSFSVTGQCSINAETVQITGAGSCAVQASQAGDSNYNAAPDVVRSFNIAKANQTITFDPLADKTYLNADFSIAATSTSGLAVSLSVVSGSCQVTGSSVHITGAGSCMIRAAQAGDSNYNAATDVDQSFNIAKAEQTITFGALAGKTFGDADFSVSATASSNLSVSFGVVSGSCTVTGSNVHITGGGACTIRAAQGGDSNYNAAPDVDQSFTIAKANQTITFGALGNKTFGDPDFTVSASSTSGLAVSFSAFSGQCTVTGNTVHITGAGSCTVRASQVGNNDYNGATDVDRSFTIGQASQAITIVTGVPAAAIYGTTFNTAATGGGSGIPVAITAGGSCMVNSGGAGSATILMTSGMGTCTVYYNQLGDANYHAAPPLSGATAAQKAAQTIVVTTGAPATAVFGTSFTVAATGGGSGNPVTYSSAMGDGCSDVGPTFNVLSGTNACQIVYNEAGNSNYNAATPVTQSVNVVGYAFNGFLQPIDMSVGTTTVWNTATAGQAIPAKWQLTLDGNLVSSLSSYVGMYSVEVACGTGAGTLEAAIEEYAPGASTITYDGNGYFHINWKTLTNYKGKCRAFYVSFNDGSSSKVAYFKFK